MQLWYGDSLSDDLCGDHRTDYCTPYCIDECRHHSHSTDWLCHRASLEVGGESCTGNRHHTTRLSDSHHVCPDISSNHRGCDGRLCTGDDIRPCLGDCTGDGGGYNTSGYLCLSACPSHRGYNECGLFSILCTYGCLCLCVGNSSRSTGNCGDSSLGSGNCLGCESSGGNGSRSCNCGDLS